MPYPDINTINFDALEQIKVEVFGILGTIQGFIKVHRDRGQLVSKDPETQEPLLPACILLDGKEYPISDDLGWQGQSRHGQMPPVTCIWEPEIHVILMPRDTVDNTGIGEELSLFRAKIHKALTTNSALLRMLGSNGGLVYRGYDSDMQQGGDLRGQMRLDYSFAYDFDPSQL